MPIPAARVQLAHSPGPRSRPLCTPPQLLPLLPALPVRPTNTTSLHCPTPALAPSSFRCPSAHTSNTLHPSPYTHIPLLHALLSPPAISSTLPPPPLPLLHTPSPSPSSTPTEILPPSSPTHLPPSTIP